MNKVTYKRAQICCQTGGRLLYGKLATVKHQKMAENSELTGTCTCNFRMAAAGDISNENKMNVTDITTAVWSCKIQIHGIGYLR